MKSTQKTIYILILILGISLVSQAQKLEKKFDKMLTEQFKVDEPGATVIVAKEGEIIYHKAFGIANMELDVKMESDMVLEIGSITKQFTAVAILMLMEEGKLNLDDDITKFIANYPTHGYHISIHHLLNHTSGIKSYTSMEKWMSLWRSDYEPMDFIDIFKNEPMDFAPGEEWRYNNSAYFLLGIIIEKASGKTYKDFIEENIFAALGMNSSYYGSMSQIIKKRAAGYQKKDNYVNAEYLSLTQPYAAGSIMSTVGDLYIWNRAIITDKLLKEESIDLAFTNYELNNGNKTNYGYGWMLSDVNGSPSIEHAGGIFGYVTNSIFLPEEDVFIAIFSNCDCNDPGTVSTKMAALAINKPFPDKENTIVVDIGVLETYVGVYNFADSTTRYISIEDNQLYSQRKGGNKYKIFPISDNSFFYEDSFAEIIFKDINGEMEATFSNRASNTKGLKTNESLPTHTEINLDEEIMKRYIGVYELNPGFDITVTLEDNKLMSQATNQQKFQIFAETETKFFLKVVDAQLEFIKGDSGDYDSFILYQGGQEIEGKKKK